MLARARFLSPSAAMFAAVCLVLPTQPAAAQSFTAEFTVSGNSTIRSWSCTASGVVELTPGSESSAPGPGFPNGIQSATVTVPVKSFECPHDEMNEHLLEALKAEEYSEIVYRLESYTVADNQVQATGTMTITGVTESIMFPLTLEQTDQGVQVEGDTRIDMTDFGIVPPEVMLGMLKVRPEIRVAFTGTVAR